MSKKVFLFVIGLTLSFSLLLFLFPQIDLAISHFFYYPQQGFLLERFYKPLHLNSFRNLLVDSTYILLSIVFLLMILGLFSKKVKSFLSPQMCLFILVCFGIAPLLTVNDLLKNHWGRARPNQIQEFGGNKTFTPAWVISDQCQKNCSFTSGETANVFCYIALIFAFPRKRKLIASIVLVVGALTIFERVAQGDHFLSDAVLSAGLDYLIIWLIFQLFTLSESTVCQKYLIKT